MAASPLLGAREKTRAPIRRRIGAPRLSALVTLGYPASGLPRRVTAPGGPLRGRHLHRTQPFTVQWTTSFSGPNCHGGTQPSQSRRQPGPSGPRASSVARASLRKILMGPRAPVNEIVAGAVLQSGPLRVVMPRSPGRHSQLVSVSAVPVFRLGVASKLEAAPGFEPGNKGFADPRLTTWLCRHPLGS